MAYQVAKNRIVWHTKEERHYYEDEKIDLSHLTPQGIAAVLASGAVVESVAPTKKESTNGKTDTHKANSDG